MEIYTIDSMDNGYYDYSDIENPKLTNPFLQTIREENILNGFTPKVIRFDNEVFKDIKKEFPIAWIKLHKDKRLFSDFLRFYFAYKYEKEEPALYIDSDVILTKKGVDYIEESHNIYFRGSGVFKIQSEYKSLYYEILMFMNKNHYIDDYFAIKDCRQDSVHQNSLPVGVFHFSKIVFSEKFAFYSNFYYVPNRYKFVKEAKEFFHDEKIQEIVDEHLSLLNISLDKSS